MLCLARERRHRARKFAELLIRIRALLLLSLLPLIPLDQLHWRELPNRFTDRTVRRICRDLADVEFVTLGQVSVLASAIREGLPIDITNSELSQLFGYSRGWAQGMLARYEQEAEARHRLSCGRLGLVESEQQQAPIQFCLRRQAERSPATVEEVVDCMRGAGKEIGRFRVKRFVERNIEKLALRQTVLIEDGRYDVSPTDIKAYFDCYRTQMAAVPSPFVPHRDEARVGAPKKQSPPV